MIMRLALISVTLFGVSVLASITGQGDSSEIRPFVIGSLPRGDAQLVSTHYWHQRNSLNAIELFQSLETKATFLKCRDFRKGKLREFDLENANKVRVFDTFVQYQWDGLQKHNNSPVSLTIEIAIGTPEVTRIEIRS